MSSPAVEAMYELPFEPAEFEERQSRVLSTMAERGLDALVVTGPENLYYLTGYSTPAYFATQALVLPADGPPGMLVAAGEVDNVVLGSRVREFAAYGPHEAPIPTLVAKLGDQGLSGGRIGVERASWFFPAALHRELEALLPDADLVDGSGLVEAARAVKSPQEIAYLRQAAGIATAAMRAASEAIRPGTSEAELAAIVYDTSLRAGGEFPGSPPYVSSGPRVCKPHATWTQRRLEAGEQVYIELSGCRRRYSAALMRTFCLGGEPPEPVRRLERAILEGLNAAITALRPGARSREVDASCRDAIAAHGFTFPHETGYSVGVAYPPGWNEIPVFNLKPGDDRVVQANMVFHFVPHTILPGLGTVGMSETVLVTETGAEPLTTFPRKVLRL